MKTTRRILVWAVIIAIGGGAAGALLKRRHDQEASRQKAEAAAKSNPAEKRPRRSVQRITLPERPRTVSPDETASTNLDQKQGQSTVTNRGRNTNSQPVMDAVLNQITDPVVKEQLGRLALSSVGVDPQADMIWVWAINDPNLSDEARQNLIEDLNEDGLSDPDNPTVDDLPMIVSRIYLIEELAESAIDDANAEAFEEAYNDLVAMYVRLSRLQNEP